MIKVKDGVFSLVTPHTSYIFRVGECGILEHLYYGRRMEDWDADLMKSRQTVKICDATGYDREHRLLFLDNLMTEVSTEGRGDYRVPGVRASYDRGHSVLDFAYDSYSIENGIPSIEGLPTATGDGYETLIVTLKEKVLPLSLRLFYSVSDTSDVIVRSTSIGNTGNDDIFIESLASLQLDLPSPEWNLMTLDGAWARERFIHDSPLREGIHINSSRNGASGAFHNPAIALRSPEATAFTGDVYGFNLIYSGNHQESVELSPYGRVRVLCGINPDTFRWCLKGGDTFCSPEAVMVYSPCGLNGMSSQMHSFVRRQIVRGYWKDRERPVLINNWEATGYDFDEEKLLKLADAAVKEGIELFVLDDGWFGKREDDTTSLGDWSVNSRKLPSGIRSLSERIHSRGMMFGIWVEPEAVSEDSDLFRSHPDWRISTDGRDAGIGRNQYVLDWTREDVTSYMTDVISAVIEESRADYVKWDMNRFLSDFNSNGSGKYYMGEFFHRYVLGYYRVMKALTERFPKVLFEGCASGGNRFDLGVLCYSPQIWTSDDTDCLMRQYIQNGTSLFYPQSVMGCHVSASPNGQTLRISSIDDRFNVASFGVLGYELDLTKLSEEEKDALSRQVKFYKKHRKLFQYGDFYRIRDYSKGNMEWMISDSRKTVYLRAYELNMPSMPNDNRLIIPLDRAGMKDKARYRITLRRVLIDRKRLGETGEKFKEMEYTPSFSVTVPAGQIENAGITEAQRFYGNGDIRATRILPDFSTELYTVEEES